MNIKEKPLIDAVSQLGPLPAFLFSNMIFTGFFAFIMCAVFGGVFLLFQVFGRGVVEAVEIFEAVRLGAIIAVVFAAIIFAGIGVSAFSEPEEKKVRLLFVFGGALGLAFLVIADRLALETLRGWLESVGPIV